MFPEQAPPLSFKNPVLSAFSNAIWQCSSAALVCKVLNETAASAPQSDEAAQEFALQRAFEAAKNWPPKQAPEMTPAIHSVHFSDGVCQERSLTPREINEWATASNKLFGTERKPFRIVRITDANGGIVWGK